LRAGAPGIEAASPRKHAGRAKLADGVTLLTVPYRLPYHLDGQNSQRRRGGTSLIEIKAASPCKHAGRAKLADGASVLVDLPLSLPADCNFTILTEPHCHRTV